MLFSIITQILLQLVTASWNSIITSQFNWCERWDRLHEHSCRLGVALLVCTRINKFLLKWITLVQTPSPSHSHIPIMTMFVWSSFTKPWILALSGLTAGKLSMMTLFLWWDKAKQHFKIIANCRAKIIRKQKRQERRISAGTKTSRSYRKSAALVPRVISRNAF